MYLVRYRRLGRPHGILAAIFTVGFIGEDSRPQLLSSSAHVALLALANWLYHRSGKGSGRC